MPPRTRCPRRFLQFVVAFPSRTPARIGEGSRKNPKISSSLSLFVHKRLAHEVLRSRRPLHRPEPLVEFSGTEAEGSPLFQASLKFPGAHGPRCGRQPSHGHVSVRDQDLCASLNLIEILAPLGFPLACGRCLHGEAPLGVMGPDSPHPKDLLRFLSRPLGSDPIRR